MELFLCLSDSVRTPRLVLVLGAVTELESAHVQATKPRLSKSLMGLQIGHPIVDRHARTGHGVSGPASAIPDGDRQMSYRILRTLDGSVGSPARLRRPAPAPILASAFPGQVCPCSEVGAGVRSLTKQRESVVTLGIESRIDCVFFMAGPHSLALTQLQTVITHHA
jgi:hypothetical protein